MSDFSINGVKTSGSIYELKAGVSIKEAHEKGKNDKIDQVYFEANGKNYVFQGEGLNLDGLNRGEIPANKVNLAGQKIQVEIDGKKVEAVIANSKPENKIEINGKTVNAKIIAIDNEANTKMESFEKGISTTVATVGKTIGGIATGLGLIGLMSDGLTNFGRTALGKDTVEGAGGAKELLLGGLAVLALTLGTTGAYGIYQDSKTSAKPEQLKPLLGKIATF